MTCSWDFADQDGHAAWVKINLWDLGFCYIMNIAIHLSITFAVCVALPQHGDHFPLLPPWNGLNGWLALTSPLRGANWEWGRPPTLPSTTLSLPWKPASVGRDHMCKDWLRASVHLQAWPTGPPWTPRPQMTAPHEWPQAKPKEELLTQSCPKTVGLLSEEICCLGSRGLCGLYVAMDNRWAWTVFILINAYLCVHSWVCTVVCMRVIEICVYITHIYTHGYVRLILISGRGQECDPIFLL